METRGLSPVFPVYTEIVGTESPLVAVVGPTGSGKSGLALALAERFGGEIVNCDSMQIYRHFDIGTAKVPADARRGIPHHLLDIRRPDELFTAGDYAHLARPVLCDIDARGRLAVIAGGTGFYLRALFDGLSPGPRRDDNLRRRLEARESKRPGSLHRVLSRLDPALARRVHPRDVNKVIRALEITLLARRPASELFRQGKDPLTGFRRLLIGLDPPRKALYARLDERCRLMFEHGLLDEVRGIEALGYSLDAKPFEALAYKQAVAVLRGAMDVAQALEDARKYTRRYAKRQWTWFRREPGVVWLDGFGDEAALQLRAIEIIKMRLSPFR